MAYIATRAAAVALVSVISASGLPALAKPLDADTCQRIKGDLDGLEKQGVRDLMARGPQAAKSLEAAQLEKIRVFMDLDAQARFRCGERAFVPMKEEPAEEPQETGAAPATIDNATPGITLPPGAQPIGPVVPPVKRRPPPPPPAAKAATAASPATAAEAAQSPPAVKKAAPKAKSPSPAVPTAPASTAVDPPAPKPKTTPARKAEKPKSDDAYRPQESPKTE